MNFAPRPGSRQSRHLMLLAPSVELDTPFAAKAEFDPGAHAALLAETQRLRGRIYVGDGAIEPWQLSEDGRHIQAADADAWHLLTVDDEGCVLACTRYLPHESDVSFSELVVSHSPLARSAVWGSLLREAVEDELRKARERGFSYVEMGGWAISEELRCSTEAVRMVLTVYALAQSLGGALGITTATSRHGSSSILRRIGGRSLEGQAIPLPPYYDPHYRCDMEILRFDSTQPEAKYVQVIEECSELLSTVPVVTATPVPDTWIASLQSLGAVLAPEREVRKRPVSPSRLSDTTLVADAQQHSEPVRVHSGLSQRG